MEYILDNLNPSQRAAVEYNDGPSLVIAGAGSGKTRVLTYKIAYLIQQGFNPWNILALTFTNKAANEMKERIGRLVGMEKARYIEMGTFHSVFSHILRREAERMGYTSQFTIYDETDSRSLIKSIVREMSLDDKIYRPSAVHNSISMAKNHIISAQDYINNSALTARDKEALIPKTGEIYIAYEQRCRNANAMDFDDLLMLTYRLFVEHEDVRRKWAEKFRFILVDEYQDTNKVQQQIVELLAEESHRVCAVGDDAQSIYAFRGATIDNILNFNIVYPEAKLFKLEQNYRSTQRIVAAANSLIKHNTQQIPKNIFSENAEGDMLTLKMTYSDKEEAAVVCKEIKRIKQSEGGEYSDFVVLYRTNAQSRTFEEECRKQGIPYRIYGGLSFYQRKEIKDIVGYFRLVVNPDDEEAFKRIINYPGRGIGSVTIDKIANAAQEYGVSLWDVTADPERYNLGVNKATIGKLQKFTEMIQGFIDNLNVKNAYDLGQSIIQESGIREDLFSSSEPEFISRQENLEEFMSALGDFVEEKREEGQEEYATLPLFIQEISLQTDKESDDGSAEKVTMMTVHSAKGLEYPTVFIVGMEENIFPSAMASDSTRALEEERRLLYVAITRAEKHCILTCAQNRWRYGKLEFYVPSHFLNEIDRRFLRVESQGVSGMMNRRRTRTWDNDYPEYSSRMQNSRPVAGQFRADAKPKITHAQRLEVPIDPLSPAFRQSIQQARANQRLGHGAQAGGFRQAGQPRAVAPTVPQGFKPLSKRPTAAGRNTPSPTADDYKGLSEGTVIEHQRFGIGTVTKLEGAGDDAKATVEFRNTGTKQLLLKFAKYSIVH